MIVLENGERRRKRAHVLSLMKRNYMLYLFLLPTILFLLLFHYAPLYGVQIAFKNFVPSEGIWGSEWADMAGMKWFHMFFSSPRFLQLLKNTLSLSLYSLIAGFPMPIILALVLNCIRNQRFKRIAQTVTYMPHFISTVVLVGMMSVFFSPRSGFINTIIGALGGPGDIFFFGDQQYFHHLYVWSGVWQDMGWGSIIYMAALAGVSPELHESAMLDGASRLKRIWYIDIPSIMPTMVILLILNCGNLMNVGFEKVYLMQNPLNLTTAEVINTYTYKIGLQQMEFSYSAAIGLFNNTINFIVLVVVNRIAGKISDFSLW